MSIVDLRCIDVVHSLTKYIRKCKMSSFKFKTVFPQGECVEILTV